jgi:hypothetical protein
MDRTTLDNIRIAYEQLSQEVTETLAAAEGNSNHTRLVAQRERVLQLEHQLEQVGYPSCFNIILYSYLQTGCSVPTLYLMKNIALFITAYST